MQVPGYTPFIITILIKPGSLMLHVPPFPKHLNYSYRYLPLSASLFYFTQTHGRNYYISVSGNDKSSGKNATSAWRSFSRLNKLNLLPGDTIFLQRAGTYEGTINIRQAGTPGKPIVITSYGEGADPVVTGSVPVKEWKATGNNRYEASIRQPVYDLYHNGQRLTPARYPNSGFLTIDKAYGKDSIECNGLQ